MTTVAIFKWAMNPHDERVFNGVAKWAAERPDVGDDDHAVVATALSAANGGEVVGLTTNPAGDLSFAAARGADRTVAIDSVPIEADVLTIATVLAHAIEKIGDVDCVCIGDASWEPCVAGVLAGLLGWPVIMEVDEVRRSDDEFVVVRRSGVGTQEIAVSGPVVLDVAARREEETKPGMRVVLAARKKPQETFSFDELNGSERTFEIEGYHDPEAVVSNVYDGTEDVDGAVAQLVAAIRAEGVI